MDQHDQFLARVPGRSRRAGAILLVAGVAAAYGRTFSGPLVFDDLPTIVGNGTIRRWSTALWPPPNTTASGRPALNLSLAANYSVSGTAVWSYHALNLVIHVLAGLTLFGIVRRTLVRLPTLAAAAVPAAFAAALLWILHPLQTEAVTYVIQRAESLMGLFYLLTLYCFIRSTSALPCGGRVWAVLSVSACCLGMATKEVMVSAPVAALLYDRTFVAGSFREAVRRRGKIYAGLGASWFVLFLLVRSTHGRSGTEGFGSGVSWWRYALTQFPAVGRYLKLSVWPSPLVFDYGTQWVRNDWAVVPSAAAVLALLAAAGWAFFRPEPARRAVGFAGAWFFSVLAPTSLVASNQQTAAEHRMYLALAPLIVLFVIGIHRGLGRAALAPFLVLAAGLAVLTFQRNEDYRSAARLWRDTVAKNPDNPRAHYVLGALWLKVPGRLDDAVGELDAAQRLKPDFAEAHNNLGFALERVPDRLDEAIAQYAEAVRLKPGLAEAHSNLGNALLKVPGRLNDAIVQDQQALQLEPECARLHYNLGNAWLRQPGRLEDAAAEYQAALRLDPDDVDARNNLGNAWARMPGRMDDAIAQYQAALRLQPNNLGVRYNLGLALQSAGRAAEAAEQFKLAGR